MILHTIGAQVDSKKLERGFLLCWCLPLLAWAWRTVMLKLCGCYSKHCLALLFWVQGIRAQQVDLSLLD